MVLIIRVYMGTYAQYVGKQAVPAEKLPELTERMLKLLEQGGFMDVETVSLYGKKIDLLSPIQLNAQQCAVFDYNYFQDTGWEAGCYDASNGHLSSNKIGPGIIKNVIMAAYILLEFYTEDFGYTLLDNSFLSDAEIAIGWINYLFSEGYCHTRMFNPWKLYCLLRENHVQVNEHILEFHSRKEYICTAWETHRAFLLDLIRYMTVEHWDYVIHNIVYHSYRKEVPESVDLSLAGELIMGVFVSRCAIRRFIRDRSSQQLRKAHAYVQRRNWEENDPELGLRFRGSIDFEFLTNLGWAALKYYCSEVPVEQTERLLRIKNILIDHESSCPSYTDPLFPFWYTSYLLPKETTLMMVADVFEMDFWQLLEDLGPLVEEKSAEWCACINEVISTSVTPEKQRTTSQFLRLEDRELSEDDRVYFWRPDGDTILSDDIIRWLDAISGELDEIETKSEDLISPDKFTSVLVGTISDANENFVHMPFFKDSFYEFISRAKEHRIQAAVILMRRMIEKNKTLYSQAEVNASWWGYGKFGERHPARLEIKRLFAVLGNPHLRKRWLGI